MVEYDQGRIQGGTGDMLPKRLTMDFTHLVYQL